jgi:hypothetical protein
MGVTCDTHYTDHVLSKLWWRKQLTYSTIPLIWMLILQSPETVAVEENIPKPGSPSKNAPKAVLSPNPLLLLHQLLQL